MPVVLLALGSRGDVQPMAWLARGLTDAGHRATVVALEEYAGLVAQVAPGASFQPVAGSVADALSRNPVVDRLGQSLPGQFVLLKRWTSRMAGSFADAVLAATDPGDTVISGVLTRGVADALVTGRGCRMATVVYTGQVPTLHRDSFFAPQYFTGWRPYDTRGARLSWTMATSLGQSLAVEVARRLADPHHSDGLGQRRRWRGPTDRQLSAAAVTRRADRHPTLVAASPLLVPPAPDWPSAVHQTGYPAAPLAPGLDGPNDPDLLAFLEREPVYVGFGSFTQFTAADETAAIIGAADLSGRPVLTLAKPGQPAGFLSGNVYATTAVPFEWLFPRVAATIHHGGSGTSHEALRSGRPTAVVPFGADQPYHAARLHALGLGPAPLSLDQLDADHLARTIDALTTTPGYIERAPEVAEQARAEDGVAATLAVMERTGLVLG